MTPSNEQFKGLKQVKKWYEDRSSPFFWIAGAAGTGKSSVAKLFAEDVDNVFYGAFTGKAAMVMRKYGCHNASTLHSLVYTPRQCPRTGDITFVFNEDSPLRNAKLIVVDEVPMVNEELGEDIMRFGVPVIVLGDPYQLPPVSGCGYFTSGKPDVLLTEIHRQALDNPIIRLATIARNGEKIPLGQYDDSLVISRKDFDMNCLTTTDQVIVGTHVTRNSINSSIREMKGFTGQFPNVGEKLICTKNNKKTNFFNGGTYECVRENPSKSNYIREIELKSLDFDHGYIKKTKYHRECFTGNIEDVDWRFKKGLDQFDFGHALTCHKSQGSQWDHTTIIDESQVFREDAARWKYTALTRACDAMTIVV